MRPDILLVGSNGMAGQAFKRKLASMNLNFSTVARSDSDVELDLLDHAKLDALIQDIQPRAVINTCAIVNIGICESEPHLGWLINAGVPAVLRSACDRQAIPLLHISTDHFFDYGQSQAHTERDPIVLKNQYAGQKYAAEQICLTSPRALVLRTSIIGFRGHGNLTLIEWAESSLLAGRTISGYTDAWTSSLDVDTFAELALTLFWEKSLSGLYNLAANEVYSKYSLLRLYAEDVLGFGARVRGTETPSSFSNRATHLGLSNNKIRAEVPDIRLPSLSDVIMNLKAVRNRNGSKI